MASTTLDPIADALVAEIDALGVEPAVTGYKWPRQDFDSVPAGAVGLPEIDRTPPDEAESQIGSDDWNLVFPVSLFFDLSEATYSFAQAVEVVEAFIKAIDANPSLGLPTIADDASVIEARPSLDDTDQARPLLAYECRVALTRLVG